MAGRKRLVYVQDPDGMFRARADITPVDAKASKKAAAAAAVPAPVAVPQQEHYIPRRPVDLADNELLAASFQVPNWNLETDSPIHEPPTSKSAEYVHTPKTAHAGVPLAKIVTSAPDSPSPLPSATPPTTATTTAATTATSTPPPSAGVPVYHLQELVVATDDVDSYIDLQAAGLEPSPVIERIVTMASRVDAKAFIAGSLFGYLVAHVSPFLRNHSNDIASTIKVVGLLIVLVIATCVWLGVVTLQDLAQVKTNTRSAFAYMASDRNPQAHVAVVPPAAEKVEVKEEKPEKIRIIEVPIVQPPVQAASVPPPTPEVEKVAISVPVPRRNEEQDKRSVLSDGAPSEKKTNRPRARSLSPIKDKRQFFVNITPYKAAPRRSSQQQNQNHQSLGLPRSQSAAEWRQKPSGANGHNPPPFTRTPSGGIPSRITSVYELKRPSIYSQQLESGVPQNKKLPPQPTVDDEDFPFINKVDSITHEEFDRLRSGRRGSVELGLGRSLSNASKLSGLHTRANYHTFVGNTNSVVREVEQY